MPLLSLYRIRQHLVAAPLSDVAAQVRRQLDTLGPPPRGPVAITAGSRGIDRVGLVVKTCGEWLRERGAEPFVVPAMGSHNGATAAGQQAMVECLGMGEAQTGLPVRSSMECVQVGKVATGPVWMDRFCHEAAGVLVVNRVKLHSGFSGPIQSGLLKMLVVGMGKIRSAETFHNTPANKMCDALLEMGRLLLNTGKVWGGLALLEDGYDRLAEVHAISASEIPTVEPRLVERHRGYFPRLPVQELNVLIVEAIGKTFSGTGMDPNVIGRRGVRGGEDLTSPTIRAIAALSLAPASQGNATGVGLADFISQRLRDAIDEEKTFINSFTTGEMDRAKIPATLADDAVLIERLRERFGDHGWMFIPNTLHLGTLYATPDVAAGLRGAESCTVDDSPQDLEFVGGRLKLDWGAPPDPTP